MNDWDWDNEGAYFEPGPHDEAVESFVYAIKEGVKQELKDELRRLKQENTELRKLKDSYNSIVKEYRIKERALELEKNHLAQTVRRERLKEILKDFEVTLYRPDYHFKNGPKCDRCNEDRRIYYKDPLDQEKYVDCTCKNRIKYFKPKIHICSSFANRNGKVTAWYKPYNEEDGYNFSGEAPEKIYSTEEYETIEEPYHRVYFRNEEECQAYCDWLTAKEEGEKNE